MNNKTVKLYISKDPLCPKYISLKNCEGKKI